MSSSSYEPDITQDSALSALLPYEQKNQIELPKVTPLQQRKKDALELAELIYKIYNENCPVASKETSGEENENV